MKIRAVRLYEKKAIRLKEFELPEINKIQILVIKQKNLQEFLTYL